MTEMWAHTSTRTEVDPSRHSFELDEDATKALTDPVSVLFTGQEGDG
ncbi:hypothetical protein [Streptomyces sp. NPDC056144]